MYDGNPVGIGWCKKCRTAVVQKTKVVRTVHVKIIVKTIVPGAKDSIGKLCTVEISRTIRLKFERKVRESAFPGSAGIDVLTVSGKIYGVGQTVGGTCIDGVGVGFKQIAAQFS